jgi:dTDP-4-dehydrorhamnose 3,5-epimerase
MQKRETTLPGVWLIEPKIFRDDRGFFLETYRAETFAALGIPHAFVQDNLAGSRRGVLRGLHYQIRHAQGKLIQVSRGEIFDVVVDLRRSSPYFGKWVGANLNAETRAALWVPPGFAHGYFVLSEWAEVNYKVTDRYAPEWERTLLWNDAALGIAWPIADGERPNLSAKDEAGKLLRDAETYE